MTRRGRRIVGAGALVSLAAAAAIAFAGAGGDEAVARTLRRVLGAPEATAVVVLERSDPFGGPPERERGRIWYIPGRGLRYKADGATGIEMGLDREGDRMLLYRPAEPRLYHAPWAKAPSRLRRIVAEPERVMNGTFGAEPETREIRGVRRSGWRLRPASLGDSLGRVSAWLAIDSGTGLPAFVSLGSDVDTLVVEFRGWTLRSSARASDLAIRVPKGTPEGPLDPRGLLDSRGDGEDGERR
ncbi:MAG TPA: hypothetical protein VFS09_05130 [Candidatus Eisenbacteria bacterium]|nr:hypothetical protein [Candidatus Eisenbacteria bacterium]